MQICKIEDFVQEIFLSYPVAGKIIVLSIVNWSADMKPHTLAAAKSGVVAIFLALTPLAGTATTYDPALSTDPLILTSNSCILGSVSGADACNGVFSGNDSNQNLDGIFGLTGWNELLKVNGSSGEESGSGITLKVTANGAETSGSWEVQSFAGFEDVMFVLKGGNTFSAFLMNTSILSGTWNNLSIFNPSGGNSGLSHFTVYATGTPAVIPLPAAGLLLISALGGLAAMRRKRQSGV